jgi:hypothetical protein
MSSRLKGLLRLLLWLAGIGLAVFHYWHGGIRKMLPTNHEVDSYDQVFYVRRAEEIATQGHTTRIQRSRMPLYPWLLSFIHGDGMSEEENFPRYKTFNAVLSIFVLAGIFLLARGSIGFALAVPLTLGAAFTFIVFKAILVQPEVLFYFLYFACFLLMLRCLCWPDWRTALAAGALTGVTHLTKGSDLPMLVLFLAMATFAAASGWWRRRRLPLISRSSAPQPTPPATSSAPPAGVHRPWVPVAGLTGFLAVTGIFFWNSVRAFGSPLYDPNTQVYFWADSPEEIDALHVLRLAQRRPAIDAEMLESPVLQKYLSIWAGDSDVIERLRARVAAGERVALEGEFAILPSARNYFRRHSWSEAAARVASGVTSLLARNFAHRNGYGRHLAVWIGTATALALLAAISVPSAFWRQVSSARWPIAFAGANIAGNVLLYGWWGELSDRNRFFLTQFLPVMVCCGFAIRYCARALPWRWNVTLPPVLGGRLLEVTPWHLAVGWLWLFTLIDVRDIDASKRQLPQ